MTASPSTTEDPLAPEAGAPRIPSFLLPSLGIALACTAVFYGILLLFLRETYLTVMFTERTAIPYMTTYLMFTALALLGGSYLHLLLEVRNFGAVSAVFRDVPIINREAVPELTEQLLKRLGNTDRRGLVVSRVHRVLRRVETRGSAADVASLLSEQAEVDRAVFSQSYATVRFIAWLIPVLGFVGTVGGISFAIAKFPALFESGTESLQDNIGPITGNLGVAFETTLLALIKIAVIIFVLYAVQKRGNELLNAFDEFCLDNLLGKVKGAGIAEDGGPFGDLARVLADHVERMEEKFEQAARNVVEHLVASEKERWESFTDTFKNISKDHHAAIQATCELMASEAHKLTHELKSWEPQFRACIDDMVRGIGAVEEERIAALTNAVGRIEELLRGSEELRLLQETLHANLQALAETGEMRKTMDRLNQSNEQLLPALQALQKRRRMQVRIVDEEEV